MKNLFFLNFLIASSIVSFGQNIIISSPVSRFEKDGKIWISFDSKNANVQVFEPIDKFYQCNGSFLKIITDTVNNKGIYKITFGDQWIEVSATRTRNVEMFGHHIMFQVMAACFDNEYVYCHCGERFKILKKNF